MNVATGNFQIQKEFVHMHHRIHLCMRMTPSLRFLFFQRSAFDIGDFDRGNSAISCPTMQYCQGLGSLTGSYYENFI